MMISNNNTAHCSLLTAHCPPLTAHCPPLTAHCPPLTAHCPPLTAHCLVSVYNLGCKLNQLEGEAIAGSFKQAGFTLVPWGQAIDGSGIIIINTCTVTSKADQKARRVIRQALRENPGACVIVAGCYATLDPQEIEAIEAEAPAGVKRLFVPATSPGQTSVPSIAHSSSPAHLPSGVAKSVLLELPKYLRETVADGENLAEALEAFFKNARGDSPFAFTPEEFVSHSRGYLKIQDGCDGSCAYCRVASARGPSVSLPKEKALERLLAFENKGCAELMITGVNISRYNDTGCRGEPRSCRTSVRDCGLAELLEYLLAGSKTIALRVSSLEPEGIDKKLAGVLIRPRIRPHFHLSVQSGSNAVLKKMGRVYAAEDVEAGAALLRSVKDDPFLACDIIAGFPGETENDFIQTFSLCERIGFAWIHAFPFSKRPGTPAFSFENQVHEGEVTRRVQALTDLAIKGRREYAGRWIGRELAAVAEKGRVGPGYCRCVSENYLKLLVKCPDGLPPPGSSLRCVPVSLCEGGDGVKADAIAVTVNSE
jgi:threonylcarbamoyladenosine tRNA methylthiotransferase MtaB